MNNSIQKVAFLDTNVLHYISLYLTQAEGSGLFPLNGDFDKAEQHLNRVSQKRLKQHLKKGLYIVDNLSMEGCRVEYSPASEIELMVGRARGKAIEKAANEGIPDRMWTRFRDEDINDSLEEIELEKIRSEILNISKKLDEAGIDATAFDERRTTQALELAMEIVGCVYMGVVDSVIYANALVARADHLVSADSYFSSMVNRISSGDQRFRKVRESVVERVAEISLESAKEVTLPDAPGWTSSTR